MLIRRKQKPKNNVIEPVQNEIQEQNIPGEIFAQNLQQTVLSEPVANNSQNIEEQFIGHSQSDASGMVQEVSQKQTQNPQIYPEIRQDLSQEPQIPNLQLAQNANENEEQMLLEQAIEKSIQAEIAGGQIFQNQNTQVCNQPIEPVLTPEMELAKKLEEIEKIDVTNLEFKERFERRRGERRRGYRRIDERTLVSRAQEEAQSIREIAAREGYKNGLEEANKELESLKNSLFEFVGAKKEAYNELSNDLLEISLEIAKKIIKKEVELSNDVLKSVLSEVFDEISSNEEKITVRVAPDEVDFARASIPEIMKNSAVDAKIIVAADAGVEKGSCIVIASNGVIDANFSTQLSIIQNAFGIYKGGT